MDTTQIWQAISAGLVVVIGVAVQQIVAYINRLGAEKNAKLIGFGAIEQVGVVAKARVKAAGKEDSPERRAAVAFKEAVDEIKSHVRVKNATADEPTHRSVLTGVDEVDKAKPSPLRQVPGILFRLLKRRVGLQ
jgi:hypothetical protein